MRTRRHSPEVGELLLIGFVGMRWLLIGLLVSLGVLLVAVGAVAWHIHVKHAELRAQTIKDTNSNLDSEKIDPKS